jgi:5-methylcytosine-specific restriction endonuclease McrA
MNTPMERYLAAMEEIRQRFDCECQGAVPTRREIAGGATTVWLQCAACGRAIRSVKKAGHDLAALPAFDADRFEDRCAARYAEESAARERFRAEATGAAAVQDAAWWATYSGYLRSEKWQVLRRLVMARDGGQCQACLRRPAQQVHHLSYELYNRIGASAAFECVAICRRCHEAIHPDMAGAQDGSAPESAA